MSPSIASTSKNYHKNSEASRPVRKGPRLPEYLQTRVLEFYFAFTQEGGGADPLRRLESVAALQLVNKHFQKIARHQLFYCYWIFDFRISSQQETGELDIINRNLDARLARLIESDCKCCRRGGLELRIANREGGEGFSNRSQAFKKAFEQAIRDFYTAVQLSINVSETTSSLIEVIWRFRYLEKLFVSSTNSDECPSLSFPPNPSLSSLPTSLVRIDLCSIYLENWDIELPSVTILTLNHVSFVGPHSTMKQATESSRDFFGSFPKLKAIGFSAIRRFDPVSLARLKVSSITHPFIDACVIDEDCDCCPGFRTVLDPPKIPFLRSLARYFRCRIKYLILPSRVTSPRSIKSILSSHPSISSHPHPPYLARLETVRILSPQMSLYNLDKPTIDDISHGILVQGHSRQAGLKNVELKWWKNRKVEKGTMLEWEPEEWMWYN